MSLVRRRLRVEFSTEPAFRSEYLSNISNGGVFIATQDRLAVRDPVVVELVLSWCDEVVELDGEVVHRIGEEMAETGALPGVAIQFELPARELRERFEPVVGPIEGNERVTKSGRRAAPRSPARISVLLQTADGKEVPCRTRDVSSTGLLISLDDQAVLPIGEEIGLVLDHPSNAETMHVNGAVVRHLKAEDGRVTALGIEFRTSAARKTEVSGFMNDIRAAEHSRRLGGISGPIAELGIENLLQMFGASSPCGTLMVTCGAEEGLIIFESGQLRAARLGGRSGRDALRTMLGWREGGFEFQAHVDEHDKALYGEPVSLNGAILDAMCAIDESARSASRSGTGAGAGAAAGSGNDGDLDLDFDLGTANGLSASDPGTEPTVLKPRTRVEGARKLDPALLPPRKKDRPETQPAAPASQKKAASGSAKTATSGTATKPASGSTTKPASGSTTKPASGSTTKSVAAAATKHAAASVTKTAAASVTKSAAASVTKTAAVSAEKTASARKSKPVAPTPAKKTAAAASEVARINQQTRFQVDARRADEQRSELDKIEQAVLDLALVGMGVARMVEVIPEPELEVYRALDGLLERGILRGE